MYIATVACTEDACPAFVFYMINFKPYNHKYYICNNLELAVMSEEEHVAIHSYMYNYVHTQVLY